MSISRWIRLGLMAMALSLGLGLAACSVETSTEPNQDKLQAAHAYAQGHEVKSELDKINYPEYAPNDNHRHEKTWRRGVVVQVITDNNQTWQGAVVTPEGAVVRIRLNGFEALFSRDKNKPMPGDYIAYNPDDPKHNWDKTDGKYVEVTILVITRHAVDVPQMTGRPL